MARFAVAVSLFLLAGSLGFGQSQLSGAPQALTAQRDPQAVAILAQALKALGGTVPSDSQASGTFERVAGSTTDGGGIQILTRGYTQTAEKLTVGGSTTQVVYSQGYGGQKDQNGITRFSLEKSLSSDSAVFPVVTIAAGVQDPNSTIQFVSTETVNGISAYHLKVSRGLSDQNFSGLSSFSAKDIWIATDSGLPVEIAYEMRDGDGSAPRIPVALFFSDYRLVDGVMYPYLISKDFDGTPYLTIHISAVSFDTGLTDQDFSLR